jgi:hypothetical protein
MEKENQIFNYTAVIVMRSWEQFRLNAYFFQMNFNIPLPSYNFY